jgi:hypothetical protein
MTPDEYDQVVALIERRLQLQQDLKAIESELLALRGGAARKAEPPALAKQRRTRAPDADKGGQQPGTTTTAVLTLMAQNPGKGWTAKTLVEALPGLDHKPIGSVLSYQFGKGVLQRSGKLYRLAKKD